MSTEALDSWTTRLWPTTYAPAPRPRLLAAALAVGALAALTVRPDVPGSAFLLAGVGVLGVGLAVRPQLTGWQRTAAVLAVALLSVTVLRSAPWLLALCLLAAFVLGTLALVGGRTWTGVALAAVATALVPHRAASWVRRTVAALRLPGLTSPRPWLVVMVTAWLLVVFGALFATADPAYASLLERALPSFELPVVLQRLFVLAVVTAAGVLAVCLADAPPYTDALAPAPGRPVRRWEWAVPVAVLDALFLSFVLVQLTVLFGGRGHVLATKGLTYAEYARQGFWQLLVVTVLTLAVVAVAVRTGPRASDRRLVQALLGLLCLLALVVVASALHRMGLYQQEYGFTRLRLLVDAVELALGATFVLLLVAGVRMSGTWLPRAVVALGAVTLLSLAALNPDAYIAEQNVHRYQETGRIDVDYLSSLSPDAVPALMRLPADLRGCALAGLTDLRRTTDPWYDVNLARARARDLLASVDPVC